MTWATTPPTAPGFWWVQPPAWSMHPDKQGPRTCCVYLDDWGILRANIEGLVSTVSAIPDGTRWAGPIPEPQEPAS